MSELGAMFHRSLMSPLLISYHSVQRCLELGTYNCDRRSCCESFIALNYIWSNCKVIQEADNQHHAIWEPNLVQVDDTIYCYYSDSRDPQHGQMIVHQVSKDLVKWSDVVVDVAVAEKGARPGMPTVVQMGNGKFIMSEFAILATTSTIFYSYG